MNEINMFLKAAAAPQKVLEEILTLLDGISLDKEKNAAIRALVNRCTALLADLQAAADEPFKVVALMNEYLLELDRVKEYLQDKYKRENLKTFVSTMTSNDFYKAQEAFIAKARAAADVQQQAKFAFIDAVSIQASPSDLQKRFRELPLSFELYISLVQRVLGSYAHDPIKRAELADQIEQDKDWILGATTGKVHHTVNPPLNTHGLVPCSDPMTIEEVCKAFGIPKTTSMEKLSKALKVDVFVQHRVIKNPILYNVMDLYGERVNAVAGPNPAMIKQMSTLRYAPQEKAAFRWRFDTESWTAPGNEKVLILNAVTPTLYKVMAPLFAKKPMLVFKTSVPFMYTDKVKSRRWMYNTQVIDRAMPHLFTPAKFDVKLKEQQFEMVDTKYLINRIYMEIDRKYDELARRKVATFKDLRHLFTNEAYTEIYSSICREEFHNYFRKNLYLINIDKVDVGEVYTSFIFYLQHYERNFSKELYDQYNTLIKKLKLEDIASMDKKAFLAVVEATLKKFITPESNIYKNTHLKLYFQKLSLVE